MIEYFIYAKDATQVDIASLKQTMREAGWIVHVVRGWLGAGGFDLLSTGQLQDEDSTFGWRKENPMSSQFEVALSRRDRPSLESWTYDGRIGYAMWTACRPFEFGNHSQFESVDDARAQMGEAYAKHVSKTQCMYVVTNCPEMEFAATVMGAVALMKNGLIEDPQMGTSILPPKAASQLANFLEQWLQE